MAKVRSGQNSPGKSYRKIIVRGILQTPGRFIAIFAIVALGVGFLSGLVATTPDMKLSVDRYFDDAHMMDVFIKGSMGFTDADIAAVAALSGIEQVEGAFVTDAMVKTSRDETLVSRIYGLPPENFAVSAGSAAGINRLELLAGRQPQKDDECLVHEKGGFFVDIPIGAILTVVDENDVYSVTKYTVTGIVRSPLFLSYDREPSSIGNGRLGAALFVRESCYALPARTDLYLTLENAAALTSLSAPYHALVDAVKVKLESLGKERSVIRREEILAMAGEELARGEAKYADGRNAALAELATGQAKLDAGERDIRAGEKELADATTEVTNGRTALFGEQQKFNRTVSDNERLLTNGEAEIAAAKKTLAESKAQLDAARDEVEKTRASRFRMSNARAREGVAQYDEGVRAWQEGAALVAKNEGELLEGRRQLETGKAEAATQFAAAEKKLDAAEEDIAAGLVKLDAAKAELAKGKRDYEKGREEAEEKLRKGAEDLDRGRRALQDTEIPLPDWYVLDRNANIGYVTYKINAEKIADVAKVFPVFFLLVAALVALTTMTRMVDEDRQQIGTLKALGYKKRVIVIKYLVYCALTGIAGCVVGTVSGFRILPWVIYFAFTTVERMPPLVMAFDWPFSLVAGALVLLCTSLAAVFSCYRSLREKPALLLLPRAPRAGKRIFLEYFPFWKRMSFTHKATARNLIRYKRRFFMTVTGIAGCTALMLTGFGLHDSMADIAHTQFERLFRYDLRVELAGTDPPVEALAIALPSEVLPPGGLLSYTKVHSETGYALSNKSDSRLGSAILVPEHAAELNGYIVFRDRKTGKALPFDESSCVITEMMGKELSLSPGDTLIVENAEGVRREFPLTAIVENYVGNYIYVNAEAYRRAFYTEEEDIAFRTVLAKTGIQGDANKDRALEEILSRGEADSAEFTSQVQKSYTDLLNSIGYVVLVLILAAGALAAIVLYNLTYINLTDRSKELATLRVLGYHHREVERYIFREIAVLSIVGALCGLLIGMPLHSFVVGVAENTDLMFGKTIAPLSYVLSVAATLLFSTLVNTVMRRKLKSIKMSESMKAVD
jgi:putative ABC transport system permease protein